MDVRHRQHVLRVVEADVLAAQERLNDFAGPLEDDVAESIEIDSKARKVPQHLGRDAFGDHRPQELEQKQQERHDRQADPVVAQQFQNERSRHGKKSTSPKRKRGIALSQGDTRRPRLRFGLYDSAP
jgi:hypothetical protein